MRDFREFNRWTDPTINPQKKEKIVRITIETTRRKRKNEKHNCKDKERKYHSKTRRQTNRPNNMITMDHVG